MSDPTILTARAAMLLYAMALAGFILARRRPAVARAALWIYSIAAAVFLAHVLAAFHYRHDWNHDHALENVRRQTAELTGVPSGIGLWLNYAFLGVWMGDILWRWRSRRVWSRTAVAVQAFMLFMAVNATIVFAFGPTRIIGLTALLALAVLGAHSFRRH